MMSLEGLDSRSTLKVYTQGLHQDQLLAFVNDQEKYFAYNYNTDDSPKGIDRFLMINTALYRFLNPQSTRVPD